MTAIPGIKKVRVYSYTAEFSRLDESTLELVPRPTAGRRRSLSPIRSIFTESCHARKYAIVFNEYLGMAVEGIGVGRQRKLQEVYAACSVDPHALYMLFLWQSASAFVESKLPITLATRSTFQLARFWLNANAELNICKPTTCGPHRRAKGGAGGSVIHHDGGYHHNMQIHYMRVCARACRCVRSACTHAHGRTPVQQ
jgi:hypothetical protein